jgi:hypothetical protein
MLRREIGAELDDDFAGLEFDDEFVASRLRGASREERHGENGREDD